MNQPTSSAHRSPIFAKGRAGTRWVWVAVPMLIAAIAIGYFGLVARQGKTHGKGHKSGAAAKAPGAPKAKQVESLGLGYPASSGRTPSTITTTYADARNRTTLTLKLTGLELKSASGYQISETQLVLVSEFAGRERSQEKGEASIDAVFEVRSSMQGALAGASPPATFESDTLRVEARPASKHSNGYSSTAEGGAARERVAFKIDTKDAVGLAAATKMKLHIGLVEASLSAGQIADFREFVARLNPKP